MTDLRFAVRQLGKSPGFTAVAVTTLALGIGACAAIFSVVNGVLLRPPPLRDPDRVVAIRETFLPAVPETQAASGKYFAWQQQAGSFESMGSLASATYNLTGHGQPVRVTAMRMTASALPTFGVAPALGRNFTAEEDRAGQDSVAILSHGLWQRQFGGRADIIDKTIYLNDRAVTVVGVMPRDSPLPERWQLFSPYAPAPYQRQNLGYSRLDYVYGRLKPGVTLGQAQAELATINVRLAEQDPIARGWGVRLLPVVETTVGEVRPVLLSLLGAVGLLLLIACANVANLLLARATARGRELAVRATMGASRGRLIRQLLVESVCLGLLGGLLGLLVAWLGLEALLALAPDTLPRASEIALDGRVLAFTILLALLTGVGFGVAPALQASQVQLHDALKESGRGATAGGRRQRLRGALVISEVAIALVLLAGAGLLMRSFSRLQHEDPGFRPAGVMTAHIHLQRPKYRTMEQYVTVAQQTVERLAAVPGVQAAAAGICLPFTEYIINRGFRVEGRPPPANEGTPQARLSGVSEDFFKAMGIPLRQGRVFQRSDVGGPQAVIINEFVARRYFPGENPIGKRLSFAVGDGSWREIVGVVGDVKADKLEGGTTAQIYAPFSQFPDNDMFFIVRSDGPPAAVAAAIRTAVSAIDPNLPIAYLRPLEEWVGLSVARQRYAMTLFGVFSAVALLLAAIGIYGVMAYSVGQRTGEIGIRMALGAQASQVLGSVLGRGAGLVGAGLAVGLAGALMLTRLLEQHAMLFGIRSHDPLTFAAIVILLATSGAAACLLPAIRAARMSPMSVLRSD
jgi:putative ABC transport system permease protein